MLELEIKDIGLHFLSQKNLLGYANYKMHEYMGLSQKD